MGSGSGNGFLSHHTPSRWRAPFRANSRRCAQPSPRGRRRDESQVTSWFTCLGSGLVTTAAVQAAIRCRTSPVSSQHLNDVCPVPAESAGCSSRLTARHRRAHHPLHGSAERDHGGVRCRPGVLSVSRRGSRVARTLDAPPRAHDENRHRAPIEASPGPRAIVARWKPQEHPGEPAHRHDSRAHEVRHEGTRCELTTLP